VDERSRRVLRDIERDLRREDPAFAARMSGDRPRFPTLSALCASLYIVVPLVSLLFGMLAVVITVDAAAVVIGTILILRRRQHRRSS
jgi:Flp pilus assembly protein TadB